VRKAEFGFTLIEILIIVALIAIIAGLSYPSLKGTVRRAALNRSQDAVFSALEYARIKAMETGNDWVVIFSPSDSSYTVFSDNGITSPGPDGVLFTDDDIITPSYRNNGTLDGSAIGETSTQRKYWLDKSVYYGSSPDVDKLACSNQSGTPPSDGISFDNNRARFNLWGILRGNDGAVYLTEGKNTRAVSVRAATGRIKACLWRGTIWQ